MPISSPFGRHSTAADIVRGRDLNGRTVLVTGGAGGLGLEAVRALAGDIKDRKTEDSASFGVSGDPYGRGRDGKVVRKISNLPSGTMSLL
jgi:hypothetical protein